LRAPAVCEGKRTQNQENWRDAFFHGS
jgi:hypothetical protein